MDYTLYVNDFKEASYGENILSQIKRKHIPGQTGVAICSLSARSLGGGLESHSYDAVYLRQPSIVSSSVGL